MAWAKVDQGRLSNSGRIDRVLTAAIPDREDTILPAMGTGCLGELADRCVAAVIAVVAPIDRLERRDVVNLQLGYEAVLFLMRIVGHDRVFIGVLNAGVERGSGGGENVIEPDRVQKLMLDGRMNVGRHTASLEHKEVGS